MPTLEEFQKKDHSFKRPEITKAKIEILDKDGEKKEREIEVLFNPAQYTLTASSGYSTPSRPASDAPMVTFTGGRASTLSMELFFYTGPIQSASANGGTEATDVSVKVREFERLVYIEGDRHSPPVVKFIWGSLSFKGVVTQLRSNFTMFAEDGMPIQAKVSISLMDYHKQKDEKRKSPFESPDRTKCRMIREDYSIWDMAKSEYGDISKWKVIARANNISNPLEIPPGTIVRIPAL